ncbi:GNAT family N-acetyltransferase [Halopiger thermotolerans]
MSDYRPLPDDREHRALFHEFRSYAFRPEEGVPAYDPDEHDTPRAILGARRGLYDSEGEEDEESEAGEDELRAVCRHYWLAARVRGEDRPVAGLASVATPPEHRRQGYVRRLLADSLAEYRERGDLFSLLWPFRYRFYRRFGWDTANRIAIHEFEPGVLSFARRADRPGTFRRLEADEYAALEAAYESRRERYALGLARDEDWWRHRVFGGGETDPFVYAYERDGEVVGYLVYTVDDGREGKTMRISEHAAVDREALLALLSFVADHDSQVRRVRLRAPESFPLRDLATDPDEIETTIETGPMVRLVDVAPTLAALASPAADASTSLTIAVDDPLAEWNDGTFALESEAGDGTVDCERVEAGPDTDPDAALDIGALSQLVVGARSATALERTGRLEASSPDATATLADLFPETDVYLGHFF